MPNFVNDPQFGQIVDFELIRSNMHLTYDCMYPHFNLLATAASGTPLYDDEPSYLIAGGASTLAYSMLLAAEEYQLAEELKPYLFTLGWTEETVGSDLLSVTTSATPMSQEDGNRQYHIRGRKWLINNSYHADYHLVVAKIDPQQNGPRSLSLFLVPRDSTKNWERIETHVLRRMVLTKFEIDGPGTLVGKVGHGLTILQRMAMPSKYICAFVGVRMLNESLRASIDHLSTKHIFGTEPIKFSNVFRQLYNLVLKTALYNFIYYRAVALSDSSFLAFHGTMLKSFLLLRINEALSQMLLVIGSKGFLAESVVGRDTFDSFVLPVFDGHYTINTLMSAKHMRRYLEATQHESMPQRLDFLRQKLYVAEVGGQMDAKPSEIRNPQFFDYADYWQQLNVPLSIDIAAMLRSTRQLMDEIDAKGLDSEAEYKYKTGVLSHWLEAVLAAGELWKMMGDDLYLNAIIQVYNDYVNTFNAVVSEGALETPFLSPARQLPLPRLSEQDDLAQFLLGLVDVEARLRQAQPHP